MFGPTFVSVAQQQNFIYAHGLGAQVPASTTQFLTPFLFGLRAATLGFSFGSAGLLKNGVARLSPPNQPASGSLVFTLFKSGVATPIVITVPAGGLVGFYQDLIDKVSIAIGDYIWWQVTNNATAASAGIDTEALVFQFANQ